MAGFWSAVRDAIRGTHQDFTEGSLGRAITLLAIPMVLETSMESLFAIVDVFFVAHLGADAVATVGLTESLLTMVFAVAMGLSFSTAAFVARRIGEKDPEAAALGAVQSIIIGIVVGAGVGIVGVAFAPELLRMMGASDAILANVTYSRIILGSSTTVMLLFLMNAAFRGAGDAAIAMRSLWLANTINIVLNPCLILGLGPFPQLGVTGSAVGTLIGRTTGVAFQFYMLTSGRGRLTVTRSQMRIDPALMRRLFRVSLNGMFQIFVGTASWLGMMRIASTFGSSMLAGYTIAIRIIIFSILPAWGMCNAGATLVGQSLGAGKPERAEKAVWLTGLYNMIFLGSLGLIFIVFAEPIIAIFTDDPNVVPIGVSCLRFVSYGYVFFAYGMAMIQAFNGSGDTFTPTMINLFSYWVVQIPLAYFLAKHTSMGYRGMFVAITIAQSTLAIVAVLAFRRGKWKQQRI